MLQEIKERELEEILAAHKKIKRSLKLMLCICTIGIITMTYWVILEIIEGRYKMACFSLLVTLLQARNFKHAWDML